MRVKYCLPLWKTPQCLPQGAPNLTIPMTRSQDGLGAMCVATACRLDRSCARPMQASCGLIREG